MTDNNEDDSKIVRKHIFVKNISTTIFQAATTNLVKPSLPDPLLGTAKLSNDDIEEPDLKKNAYTFKFA